MQLQDYQNQVEELIHDSSNLDFSLAELTNFINNSRTRVALDFACVRNYFFANAIVGQETYPINGGIAGAQVLTGGSGYSPATSIFILSPPGTGTPATAVPVISNGVITGINMTSWGSGYSTTKLTGATFLVTGTGAGASNVVQLVLGTGTQASVAGFASGDSVTVSGVTGTNGANGTFTIDVVFGPGTGRLSLRGSSFDHAWVSGGTVVNNNIGVFITDSGGGSGATASTLNTAMVNVIDFHTVSVLFGVQRTMLQWKPFAYFNAVYRSNTTTGGQPAVWSNYTEQNKVYLYPAQPDQPYPLEIDAYVLPTNLVNATDSDTQINAPMSDCVQFYASHLALLKAQNFDQADYYRKRYEGRRNEIANTRLAVRRLNIYQNVYRRMQRGY